MSTSSIGSDHPDTAATLRAVILYEDYDSGCRAKALVEQMSNRGPGEGGIFLALWRLDVLHLPGAAGAALRDFGCADLVVLAWPVAGRLPRLVLQWVECWAKCRADADSALVVLRDGQSSSRPAPFSPADGVAELRQVATRHGVNFFCQGMGEPDREAPALVERLRQREAFVIETMHGRGEPAAGEDCRRAGIND